MNYVLLFLLSILLDKIDNYNHNNVYVSKFMYFKKLIKALKKNIIFRIIINCLLYY
jgi:hypothetical protein